MSKALRKIAVIASAVALVATGVGAAAGAGLFTASTAAGAATAASIAATATTVATVATLTAGVAGIAAQITAPKPRARGSITQVVIAAEPPRPYMVGESFSAGVLRYQTGYGATLKKVPNPFLLQVKVFSGVGPVEELVEEQFDFAAIGSYYTGFYDSDTQLGARPESAALVPPFGTAPGWGSSSKLSGCAAIASNYKFDKDGKVFASGIPLHGAIWKGEKAYDPRKDDTYPGGEGDHRLGEEDTYEYTANPALHAATYAYGRFQNGIKVFGIGISGDAIDWAAVVDWANDCETNEWECHGTIWEGGQSAGLEQRVSNLDDLCAAGGGRWITAGALLSFDWHRPRVALATLTDDDLLEAGISTIGLQSLRDRMNGVRPQYISPSHNWEQITADEIIGSTYRTEDGQKLTQTWPLNLVKAPEQAGQLATYAMADSREIGPIEVNVNVDWRFYRPGETIDLDSDLIGYDGQAVILSRSLDPDTLAVKLTLKTETEAKHAYALGEVASPPPTPILGQDQEDRDAVVAGAINPAGYSTVEISGSYTSGLAGNITQTHVGSGNVEVTIPNHTRIYSTGRAVSVTGDVLTLPETTTLLIYYDDPATGGGAVTYETTSTAADAYFSATNPDRHFIAVVTTVDEFGEGGGTGGSSPPGGGGWSNDPPTQVP